MALKEKNEQTSNLEIKCLVLEFVMEKQGRFNKCTPCENKKLIFAL
jgi:hypothetical protein